MLPKGEGLVTRAGLRTALSLVKASLNYNPAWGEACLPNPDCSTAMTKRSYSNISAPSPKFHPFVVKFSHEQNSG